MKAMYCNIEVMVFKVISQYAMICYDVHKSITIWIYGGFNLCTARVN